MSGCCAPLQGGGAVCAPAINCTGGNASPPVGTVLATDSSGNFLIQTTDGPEFFDGPLCLGIYVGDQVTFQSSTALCFTNEISVRGTSCSVTCTGQGYPGAVVSASNSTDFVVTTTFGDKLFTAQTACFDVMAADQVVFTGSTGACASNTFADVRSGKFCRVWCP